MQIIILNPPSSKLLALCKKFINYLLSSESTYVFNSVVQLRHGLIERDILEDFHINEKQQCSYDIVVGHLPVSNFFKIRISMNMIGQVLQFILDSKVPHDGKIQVNKAQAQNNKIDVIPEMRKVH